MQNKIRHFAILIAWIVCALIGLIVYQWSNTPTTPFTGFWSGQAIAEYPRGPIIIKTQLIIDDAQGESARLIAQFLPTQEENEMFQSTVTTSINVIKRQDKTLTFSLSDVSYSDKANLEEYFDRTLPIKGAIITGKAWAIEEDEIFIYLILPFGEKMGVVLTRHD